MPAVFLSSLVVAASLGAEAPKTDILSGFYGNTLETVDKGIETYFYYKPDHTFTGTVPQYGYPLAGTWSINRKGEVCRVFDPLPPMMSNPDCGPMLVRKVGDRGRDKTGHSERLIAGIVP